MIEETMDVFAAHKPSDLTRVIVTTICRSVRPVLGMPRIASAGHRPTPKRIGVLSEGAVHC
jgi:hypothetical protein